MKKLMIALAAVACAAGVQAAQINWSGTKGALNGTQTDPTKYTIVLIDAACYDQATAIADLKAGGLNYEADDILRTTPGILQTVSKVDYFRFTEAKVDQVGGLKTYGSGDTVTAYAIIFNNSVADATEAMITKTVSSTIGDNNLAAFAYGDMSAAGAIAQGWTAVPEPTSGLLLLIGVAGLALRRRRA